MVYLKPHYSLTYNTEQKQAFLALLIIKHPMLFILIAEIDQIAFVCGDHAHPCLLDY